MQTVWETAQFKEIYDANTTPFELGTPCLRVQTFCHSVSYKNWKHETGFSRPSIIAFMILSGKQQLIRKDGSKEIISDGYFSMEDLNNSDIECRTLSGKAERYFILFEKNDLLVNLLNTMFPSGLPTFKCIAPGKIQQCFENIHQEIVSSNPDDTRIGGAAYSLLHEVINQLPAEPLPKPLILALNCIENNFHDVKLSREDIARASRVSVSTLGSLFRKYKNTTIWQTLCSKRMENVKQLLTFSNKSMSDIANECGFSYSYYLTREFKNLFGITPSKYRSESRRSKI